MICTYIEHICELVNGKWTLNVHFDHLFAFLIFIKLKFWYIVYNKVMMIYILYGYDAYIYM